MDRNANSKCKANSAYGKHVKYLHICEAAPTKKTANQVGKLITYLITDFIKAKNTKNE